MLSSHQLQQVQQICNRVGIIVKGRLIVQGEMDALGKAILKGRQWNFLLEVGGNRDSLERICERSTASMKSKSAARMVFALHQRCSRPEVVSLVIKQRRSACYSCDLKIRRWKRSI